MLALHNLPKSRQESLKEMCSTYERLGGGVVLHAQPIFDR